MATTLMKVKHNYLYRNGLVLAFLLMAIFSLIGQFYNGKKEYNDFLLDHGQNEVSGMAYLISGHFVQATFENWESEFLQMLLFVVLTIFLRQKGSSESKSCDEPIIDEKELTPKADSPWPVKKGGFWLAVYKHSLSLSLLLLFLLSTILHCYGSWKDYNQTQILENKPTKELLEFTISSKFWFESFQNWQSEFLSVFAIIFLSIYLRQIGSSQSKPVNASHDSTGSQ
jgi:hypothetical protein